MEVATSKTFEVSSDWYSGIYNGGISSERPCYIVRDRYPTRGPAARNLL